LYIMFDQKFMRGKMARCYPSASLCAALRCAMLLLLPNAYVCHL